jgi:hypothetical protein
MVMPMMEITDTAMEDSPFEIAVDESTSATDFHSINEPLELKQPPVKIDEVSMDDKTVAMFKLLAFEELPDSDGELSMQNLVPPRTQFTFFNKLPIEMRIRIWRLCFPRPRLINLQPRFHFYSAVPNKHNIAAVVMKEKNVPQPVTLQINKESRNETLKFYSTIYMDSSHGDAVRQAICASTSRDRIYVTVQAATFPTLQRPFRDAYHEYPEFFDKIKILELRNWQFFSDNGGQALDWNSRQLSFPKIFRNLEELRIVLSPLYGPTIPRSRQLLPHRLGPWIDDMETESRKELNGLLRKLRLDDPELKIPVITFQKYKKKGMDL